MVVAVRTAYGIPPRDCRYHTVHRADPCAAQSANASSGRNNAGHRLQYNDRNHAARASADACARCDNQNPTPTPPASNRSPAANPPVTSATTPNTAAAAGNSHCMSYSAGSPYFSRNSDDEDAGHGRAHDDHIGRQQELHVRIGTRDDVIRGAVYISPAPLSGPASHRPHHQFTVRGTRSPGALPSRRSGSAAGDRRHRSGPAVRPRVVRKGLQRCSAVRPPG
ncbi:hypothetical protein GCM10010341_69640 [Streptomyces noursei]|nr:hypothetical protein GCM10010341_69640 [Streptomyces noursei]